MAISEHIIRKLEGAFDKRKAAVLAEVIGYSQRDIVKAHDFNELKEIIKELAEAQRQTDKSIKELSRSHKELAEAQKRSEIKIEGLAEAQRHTDKSIEELTRSHKELAEAQKRTEVEVGTLARGMEKMRVDMGGLSRSLSYAFENEAYRMLPSYLKRKHNIEMEERFVRKEVAGKEINIFGHARKNGRSFLVVGEAKLRLDKRDRGTLEKIIDELESKVSAVAERYPNREVVKVLVSHYATGGFIKDAKKRGILVIQSYEW